MLSKYLQSYEIYQDTVLEMTKHRVIIITSNNEDSDSSYELTDPIDTDGALRQALAAVTFVKKFKMKN